ncbi:MAG: helix-turn-helix transcriptional regulator [Clostridia bacterium]|nr:helix-turn-helix transcriptional regulator [Clostridia bacterium]
MGLGNKILNLRKKLNLSQEQLAEQLNVTRQTISKWELEETTPDIKQAKKLSEIFKVSLDELLDTDIRDTVVEKVSNTEKLTSMAVKIVKVIGIAFLIMLIIDIITMIIFLPKII